MKDSFILFKSSKELIDELSESQKASLLDALFAYAEKDEVPELDPMTRIVFKTMRQKIDAANERYEQRCNQNKENGNKGGRPKKTENQSVFLETEKTITDNDGDCDNDGDLKRKAPTEPKEKRQRFTPPTVQEVEEYCEEVEISVDAERFVDYYTSVGWKVGGKGVMKDWKAAARNWAKRDKGERPPNREKPAQYHEPGESYMAGLADIDYTKLLYKGASG